jgi:TonB dependent receptor
MFPFTVRYFDPIGWFSTFGVTYAHQEVDRVDDIANLQGSDDFAILNASIGFRFPDRRGIVGFEVRNLLNDGFEFQDDNFRSSEIRRFPLVPERTFVARLTLNF